MISILYILLLLVQFNMANNSSNLTESLQNGDDPLWHNPGINELEDNGEQILPEEMKQVILELHNCYRKCHDAQALSRSSEVERVSQNWADKMASGEVGFGHNPGTNYGENLYYGSGSSTARSVKLWYDEIQQYDFGRPGFSSGTGHFTQLVWKKSKYLGVGVACTARRCYVVCNYDPAGNFLGRFKENVVPPTSQSCSKSCEEKILQLSYFSSS